SRAPQLPKHLCFSYTPRQLPKWALNSFCWVQCLDPACGIAMVPQSQFLVVTIGAMNACLFETRCLSLDALTVLGVAVLFYARAGRFAGVYLARTIPKLGPGTGRPKAGAGISYAVCCVAN